MREDEFQRYSDARTYVWALAEGAEDDATMRYVQVCDDLDAACRDAGIAPALTVEGVERAEMYARAHAAVVGLRGADVDPLALELVIADLDAAWAAESGADPADLVDRSPATEPTA